jgi:hypothetical protein
MRRLGSVEPPTIRDRGWGHVGCRGVAAGSRVSQCRERCRLNTNPVLGHWILCIVTVSAWGCELEVDVDIHKIVHSRNSIAFSDFGSTWLKSLVTAGGAGSVDIGVDMTAGKKPLERIERAVRACAAEGATCGPRALRARALSKTQWTWTAPSGRPGSAFVFPDGGGQSESIRVNGGWVAGKWNRTPSETV